MSDRDGNWLLALTLEAAVPLRIMELQDAPEETLLRLAREASEQIAAHGDNILYKGARRGDTASAVGWLITGLACAARQPGGVRFGGQGWCAAHPRHRWQAEDGICMQCLADEDAGRAAAGPVPDQDGAQPADLVTAVARPAPAGPPDTPR